ncbi:hypothetical protein [Pseudomonas sp. 31 E 6]|uniref:hypothetical protein n=1 Tax=unclassified Pseudomonas TaxID=196821 RepID=UPI0008120B47|nr:MULTISPECIES: hypothetical protein [unclassified Pseudomonas]CRM15005.1 hypothetical protein [Pseudomonas sp. 31 E 5]CRM24148.1 hypothetical protein [Pseudomonas sp. 31 E 6]
MSQILTNTGKRFDLLTPNAKTSLDAQKKNSLCCAAAGITAPSSTITEALIPHEMLTQAATLIIQNRPPPQPVVGYKRTHPLSMGFLLVESESWSAA